MKKTLALDQGLLFVKRGFGPRFYLLTVETEFPTGSTYSIL